MIIFHQMVEVVDILAMDAPEGCEGSSMKGDVFFSGKVRFAKEQWHVSYVFTNLKTATSSIEDKWVGIKFIVYNFVENSKIVVKTELWLDTNNNGNFVKVDENVDRGGWGTEGTECGGAPDQIISWGGPITTFRWDTATDVDFKNLKRQRNSASSIISIIHLAINFELHYFF